MHKIGCWHAGNTACAGKAFILAEATDNYANVSGLLDSLGAIKDEPAGICCTAYDSADGKTFILAFGQALFFGEDLDHLLLFPIIVLEQDLIMPFSMFGTISYLPIRLPTKHKLNTIEWTWLTSKKTWEPYLEEFGCKEGTFRTNSKKTTKLAAEK